MQFQNAVTQGVTDTRRETLRGSCHSCLHSLLGGCNEDPLAPVCLQRFAVTSLTASSGGSVQPPPSKWIKKAAHERFFPFNCLKTTTTLQLSGLHRKCYCPASCIVQVFTLVSCGITHAFLSLQEYRDSWCQCPSFPKYHPVTWRQQWQGRNWEDQNHLQFSLACVLAEQVSYILSTFMSFKKVKLPI